MISNKAQILSYTLPQCTQWQRISPLSRTIFYFVQPAVCSHILLTEIHSNSRQEKRPNVHQYGSCAKLVGIYQVISLFNRHTNKSLTHSTQKEFRKVREVHQFFDICRTPALATEITLQPVQRYSGLLDAAIIFSDILVVPQAMGMEVLMNPGPQFPEPLDTPEDIKKLKSVVNVDEELGYVYKALTQTRIALNGEVPLIGFCGGPWTLFSYMIEGGGSKTFQKAKTWLFKYPEESKALLQRIADICVDFLVGQIKAGAQVSIFFDIFSLTKLSALACPSI